MTEELKPCPFCGGSAIDCGKVETDIGTVECIGRCLGGAFERDLLAHAKRIRTHIAALEADNKRLRDALKRISNQRNLSTDDETLNAMRFTSREALAQTDEPAKS